MGWGWFSGWDLYGVRSLGLGYEPVRAGVVLVLGLRQGLEMWRVGLVVVGMVLRLGREVRLWVGSGLRAPETPGRPAAVARTQLRPALSGNTPAASVHGGASHHALSWRGESSGTNAPSCGGDVLEQAALCRLGSTTRQGAAVVASTG